MKSIDLNCDVGEGLGNEDKLLPYISSCNIACGGHAGDEETMDKVIALAIQHKVKIGAHPSYPDRENFGRKTLEISPEDLKDSIREQLAIFSEILQRNGGTLNHIKPHGALYNDLAKDKELCKVFLEAITPYKQEVKLYVPFGSVIAKEAKENGWMLVYEVFGDRNYNEDLSLVSRMKANALIRKPDRVLGHMLNIIESDKVMTVSGQFQPIKAETFCLHGDTPEVLEILMYLSREFPNRDIRIQ